MFLIVVFSFPRILQEMKIVMLMGLLLCILFMKRVNFRNYKTLIIYLLFFPIALLVAGIYGNEIQYIISSIKINLVFPILLCIVFFIDKEANFINVLRKSAFISLIITFIISLSTLLNGIGVFPINLNAIFYQDENRIGFHSGFIHIINSPLSYYLFLIPIVFSKREYFSYKNWKFYFFIILFIFSILTGRRILLLPFILVGIYQLKQFYKYIIPLIMVFTAVLTTNKFENFSVDKIAERFTSAINSTEDSEVREVQVIYFEKYIDRAPLLGYGLGAYMPDYLRNEDFKTAYERSMHYMFFVLGLPIGVLLLIFYFYLLRKVWISRLNYNQDDIRGIAIGIFTILIASHTNPYWMSGFDYVLPFSILIVLASNNKLTNDKKKYISNYSNIQSRYY